MLGPLCDQTDKRYPFVKHNEDWKKYASLNNSHKNSHRNHTNRAFYKNIFILIDRSNFAPHRTHVIDFCVLCLWGFFCVRDAGHRGNKITDTREAPWPSVEGAGLVIHTPQVQVAPWPLAGFALSSPKFKSSAVLVKSQLVCLNLPAGILNLAIFYFNLFVIHYPWKPPRREDNWVLSFLLFLLLQIFSLLNIVFSYFSLA